MPRNRKQEAIETLKRQATNSGIFANLETIGSYHDFSQIAFVDYLDESRFSALLNNFQSQLMQGQAAQTALQQNYESITRFYATCVHELTHWLDHTSTLWGQRQLVFIYNAINAWTNQDEQEFYRIAIANSERHRARLALYYTEEYQVNQQESINKPWEYEYGSGLEFGIDGRPRPDRPFVFTVFSNSSSQRICRVPFSMFALTEANATYAEFKVESQGLALLDNDSRLVEQFRLEQEIQQNIYNEKLVIYSVATHCLANSSNINESFKAYELSSALATFCLNLPKSLFNSLKIPEEFNVWGDRVQALKELADPGFAFFTIARQAPEYSTGLSVGQWLQEALENAGLPNLKEIVYLAANQMEELENEIIDGLYSDGLKTLLSIGRNNFTERGIWGQNVLSMENLQKNSIMLPPIVLGDGFVTPVAPKTIPIGQEDMDQWIEQIIDIEVSLDRFIRACRF